MEYSKSELHKFLSLSNKKLKKLKRNIKNIKWPIKLYYIRLLSFWKRILQNGRKKSVKRYTFIYIGKMNYKAQYNLFKKLLRQ